MKEDIIDMFTCKDGSKYAVLATGAVKHVNPVPFTYDAEYSAVYDTPEYQRNSDILQAMRYSFATGAHGGPINSLLDCGYGNGAFMKFARQYTRMVLGYDVTGVPVPEGCISTDDMNAGAQVITFHDCLEHFHDINFVRDLNYTTLVVSLPNCPFSEMGKEWFENEYPHRKPSEHIWHFSASSLAATMALLNWRQVARSYHETIVRNRYPRNILSMAFKRP